MNIYPSSLIEAIDTGSGVMESFEVNGVSVPIAKMSGYVPLDFLHKLFCSTFPVTSLSLATATNASTNHVLSCTYTLVGGSTAEFFVFYDYSDTIFEPLAQMSDMVGIKDRAIRHEYPMSVPFTVTALLDRPVRIECSDTTQYIQPAYSSGDFCDDFNKDFLVDVDGVVPRVVNIVVPANTTSTYVDVIQNSNTIRYRLVTACDSRYSVFYMNRLGGWQTLCMQGYEKRTNATEAIAAISIRKDRFAGCVNNSGVFTAMQNYRKTLYLHTGYLTSKERTYIDDLLTTERLYVFDQVDRVFRTATIENKTQEIDYSRRLVDYTLQLKLNDNFGTLR